MKQPTDLTVAQPGISAKSSILTVRPFQVLALQPRKTVELKKQQQLVNETRDGPRVSFETEKSKVGEVYAPPR